MSPEQIKEHLKDIDGVENEKLVTTNDLPVIGKHKPKQQNR